MTGFLSCHTPHVINMATFRIYLRYPDQRVAEKTVTPLRDVALLAFSSLVNRTELDGFTVIAVLNFDGKQVAIHDFHKVDPSKYWRGKLHEIVWPSASR